MSSVHQPVYRRYVRGKQRWSNFDAYGWWAICSCGWEHRHNGPKSGAVAMFREHQKTEDGKTPPPRQKP